jgi:photosystem II stability/assembly factor-like uncharacterized protein
MRNADTTLQYLQSQSLPPSRIVPGAFDGSINLVRVDPADNRRIYLGLSPLVDYMSRGDEGTPKPCMLVVSDDRGATWRLLAELPGRRVVGIFPGSLAGREGELTVFTDQACQVVDRASGKLSAVSLPVERIAYAESGTDEKGTVIYILSSLDRKGGKVKGGVFRSKDWGKTWVPVNEGLFEGVPAGERPDIRALAVCAKHPEVVYLSSGNSRSSNGAKGAWNYGIFKTDNGGDLWKPVSLSDGESYLTGNYKGSWLDRIWGPGWGGNPIDLGVDPNNPDFCYGSDAGRAYRTTDGGKTWAQIYSAEQPDGSVATTGLNVTTCYRVVFDPFDKEHFFITYTDIALFHTLNGGKSWFPSVEGIPREWVNTCYWLEFDPGVRDRAWSVWGNAHDLPRDKMFGPRGFERNSGGVAVTEDGGRSWKKAGTGIPENSVGTCVVLDPESPKESRTLYFSAFGRGVYKSADGGATWTEANNGLGDNRYAWELRRGPQGRLFVLLSRGRRPSGTVDGAVYFSDDKAATWQPLALPEGVNAPHDLEIDPRDQQRIYLGCWTRDGADGTDASGGMFRSDDGGKTWKRIFDARIRVNSLALHPANPDVIFINTFQNAAWRSDDRGETWKRLEGYRFKWGQRPNLDPSQPDLLYLSTYGGSVFCGPAEGIPGVFEDIENIPKAWW